jgi:hypothetical protein
MHFINNFKFATYEMHFFTHMHVMRWSFDSARLPTQAHLTPPPPPTPPEKKLLAISAFNSFALIVNKFLQWQTKYERKKIYEQINRSYGICFNFSQIFFYKQIKPNGKQLNGSNEISIEQ